MSVSGVDATASPLSFMSHLLCSNARKLFGGSGVNSIRFAVVYIGEF